MSQLPTITGTLTPPQLSDLFFNHVHPHLDKAYATKEEDDTGLSRPEILEAITLDAKEFSSNYLADLVSPVALAEDFMNRL